MQAQALELLIDRIQPYEHNPRHTPNPAYDRIRDSDRIRGLDQPLIVTQRPRAVDYIVQAGGNTRLLIMKQLFEEHRGASLCTGAPSAPALARRVWTSCWRIFGRMISGDLTFIEKARAVL